MTTWLECQYLTAPHYLVGALLVLIARMVQLDVYVAQVEMSLVNASEAALYINYRPFMCDKPCLRAMAQKNRLW